jgi:hypothetical protein
MTFSNMEVNTNFSAVSMGGIAPQKPAAPAASNTAASDAFAGSNALASAVKNLPASRPDSVALAKELISDPNYPPASVTRQVSALLAESLVSDLQ